MRQYMKTTIMYTLDEQQAHLNLRAVTKPKNVEDVMAEVDRREAIFNKYWDERPESHDCTALCAALRSVCNDVRDGWL